MPFHFQQATLTTLGLVLGAILGSAATCYADRWVLNQSFVTPSSHCPACKTPLAVWQLIPVVGFLLQGGKCATCRATIPVTSTVIELACGVYFATYFLAPHAHLPQLPLTKLTPLILVAWSIPLALQDLKTKTVSSPWLIGGTLALLAINFAQVTASASIELALTLALLWAATRLMWLGTADWWFCLLVGGLYGGWFLGACLCLASLIGIGWFFVTKARVFAFIPALTAATATLLLGRAYWPGLLGAS